jgi:hypothetical protein
LKAVSHRTKLLVGLGAVAVLAVVVFLLRPSKTDDEKVDSEAMPARADTSPTAKTTRERPSITPAADGDESPVETDPQDETGEPIGAGPAKGVELPERPEGALDNTPTREEYDEVHDRVMRRLDEQIARAEAAGDTAEAERLKVRRARLERKRAEKTSGDDDTADP